MKNMSKKVFCYLRVENVKDKEVYTETESYKNQVSVMEDYCRKNRLEISKRCYGCETETRASENDYSVVDDLLDLVLSHGRNIVLFDKLERFSNDPLVILDLILKLKRHNIDFECVAGELGTLTHIGRSNLFSYLSLMEFRKGLVSKK